MTTILFRPGDWTDDEELHAAQEHFDVVTQRGALAGSPGLVIPRYAALPFYRELEADVRLMGGHLINTYRQHAFVADMREWVPVLGDLTPRTWWTWERLPSGMSFVLKGATNSRKHEWNRRMFAATAADVPRVAASLMDDDLIASQGLVVREYVPLRTFALGLNGLPITNEWRFFCYRGQIVEAGYYWASEPEYEWRHWQRAHASDPGLHPSLLPAGGDAGWAPAPQPAGDVVVEALALIGDRIDFVVVDVAETARGDWIVIELNDGSQSGLSMIPPTRFYAKLAAVVSRSQDIASSI